MRTLFLSLLVIFPLQLFAQRSIEIEYLSNYDGDTVSVRIPKLEMLDQDDDFPFFWEDVKIRVRGIDTPEIRGKCQSEKKKAIAAKQLVKELLEQAESLEMANVSKGKYFRLVADIIVDGESLGERLLAEGLAVPYDGGTKPNWCNSIE